MHLGNDSRNENPTKIYGSARRIFIFGILCVALTRVFHVGALKTWFLYTVPPVTLFHVTRILLSEAAAVREATSTGFRDKEAVSSLDR